MASFLHLQPHDSEVWQHCEGRVVWVQASVYGSREAALTPEIFRKVLQMKLREHEQRLQFEQQAGEEQTQQPSQ